VQTAAALAVDPLAGEPLADETPEQPGDPVQAFFDCPPPSPAEQRRNAHRQHVQRIRRELTEGDPLRGMSEDEARDYYPGIRR